MKKLFLVRHAKASREESALTDFERPLNRRGERDAPIMGERLARRAVRPDRVISSDAVRALSTARLLAEAINYDAAAIQADNRLYGADAGDLLTYVRDLDDAWQTVMLVGHNPAITDLVNALTDAIIDNVPTCGVLAIEFDGDAWSTIELGDGHLAAFDFPKQ